MKRLFIVILCCLLQGGLLPVAGQECPCDDFLPAVVYADSLLRARGGVNAHLRLKKAVKRSGTIEMRLTGWSDFPLRSGDISLVAKALKDSIPERYRCLEIRPLTEDGTSPRSLVVSEPGSNGEPASSSMRTRRRGLPQLVDRGIKAPKGLSGRHVALWNSHGYYYQNKYDKWMWQRSVGFQTVEDIYTLEYVLPLLAPMLENAGANVLLPRERDWHCDEILMDNDPCCGDVPCSTDSLCCCGSPECACKGFTGSRTHGTVEFTGRWKTEGKGFADISAHCSDDDRPFTAGTAMKAECSAKRAKAATAVWSAGIPARGEYAVYVSYATLPKSISKAHYTVHALGGDREVFVNQKMGGGTWVYIGTYEFDEGFAKRVTLSGFSTQKGVVTADAVKIGGGMGCFGRGGAGISGMPRYAEGARYFLQWSGFPDKVWSQNEGTHDYRDDLMCRGKWVGFLAGGSPANPGEEGLGIPVDLSIAFHTDAGVRSDDSVVGTLAIYTLKCNGSTVLPDGVSRATCRELTDFMQTQVTGDIRTQWDPMWARRQLWNKSYSESRTTSVPAVLLELLSHQNFEDMKYGLDPAFRFTVARACYKAVLKYLAMHYGRQYAVQPLPVRAFSASLESGRVTLRWKENVDSLESTASPTAFIVHTRIDGGGWDGGVRINPSCKGGTFSWQKDISAGHIYSFKVVAANDGGLSFPSEILSVGFPEDDATSEEGPARKILIVNGFGRISAPAWFDTPAIAGFDNRTDSGVPYIRSLGYTGEQFEMRRRCGFEDNDRAGFGASGDERAGHIVAGNTFDYPSVHGSSLLKAGFAFDSCSGEAFAADSSLRDNVFAVDLIYGKECKVKTGSRSPVRGGVLTGGMMQAVRNCTARGTHIIISGSHIGRDIFDSIYQGVAPDTELGRQVRETLGYSLRRAYASSKGLVAALDGSTGLLSYPTQPNQDSYCVESPDALYCFGIGATVYMNYVDTGLPAAVRTDFGKYKVAAFGFPLEIISSGQGRDAIFSSTLQYLAR